MSYGIYIGRNLTADGRPYLAGYGDEPSSHWLELMPRATHGSEATITVGVTPQAGMPGRLSQIPQAPETWRNLRVSYSHYLGVPAPLTNGGLNEHGVAVRDIWSPSRPELIAMTATDQTGPNYSDLARIVIERARTAREGVDLIADLIAEHGYSTYGGNSHMIADATEAWVVIEFAGAQGLWVAERLGVNSIRASRPGYVGEIPAQPDADYLFPDHFIDTAVENGWYDSAQGPFDVNRVYGDGKGRWEGVAFVEDEMARRAARPERIELADVCWAISDARITGDTAGYGQVVPLEENIDADLRMIWHAPVGPVTAPLMPVFLGQTRLPLEYGIHRYLTEGESARFLDRRHESSNPDSVSLVPQGQEVSQSAFYVFKRLMHVAFQQAEPLRMQLWDHWRTREADLAREVPEVLRSAEILIGAGERELATRLLTDFSCSRLTTSLVEAEALMAAGEVLLRSTGVPNMTSLPQAPNQIW